MILNLNFEFKTYIKDIIGKAGTNLLNNSDYIEFPSVVIVQW